jgi:hypothetical protein
MGLFAELIQYFARRSAIKSQGGAKYALSAIKTKHKMQSDGVRRALAASMQRSSKV